MAVIRVGAATEVELKEKKHRVEDALQATRAAVEEGIVPGGGIAYINALPALDELLDELRRRQRRADRRGAAAAGARGAAAPDRDERRPRGLGDRRGGQASDQLGEGYDAAKGEYVNMIERGIIDPLKVTRSALENAASIATMILTTETLITEVPEKNPPAAAPAMPEY